MKIPQTVRRLAESKPHWRGDRGWRFGFNQWEILGWMAEAYQLGRKRGKK